MPAKLRLNHSADDFSSCSLEQLCGLVQEMKVAYDDVAEQVEDKAFAKCDSGEFAAAVHCLGELAAFFERMENKNEEVDRDLADLYVLIGDMHLSAQRFDESRQWFEKAIVVDDNYDIAYHSMANACMHIGDEDGAIRSWEQEIRIAPGNYYTYLQLAGLYEKRGDLVKFVDVLERLLSRDTHNIRALHTLIMHYERHRPGVNTELLRRRLINADHEMVKMELVIWTYHMCRENRGENALRFLENHEREKAGLTLVHLLKAHLFGLMRQYARKRRELSVFKRLCHGSAEAMKNRLEEFASVFGEKAAHELSARLMIARPWGCR